MLSDNSVVRLLVLRQITVPDVVSKPSGFPRIPGAVTSKLLVSICRRPPDRSDRKLPEKPRTPGRVPLAATPTSTSSIEISKLGMSASKSLNVTERLRTIPLGSISPSISRCFSLSHGITTAACAKFRYDACASSMTILPFSSMLVSRRSVESGQWPTGVVARSSFAATSQPSSSIRNSSLPLKARSTRPAIAMSPISILAVALRIFLFENSNDNSISPLPESNFAASAGCIAVTPARSISSISTVTFQLRSSTGSDSNCVAAMVRRRPSFSGNSTVASTSRRTSSRRARKLEIRNLLGRTSPGCRNSSSISSPTTSMRPIPPLVSPLVPPLRPTSN